MALQLPITNPYDGDSEGGYYKVIETNINWLNKLSHVVLGGYFNKQARLDGKQPIECVSFDWSGDDFPFDLSILNEENENTVAIAYAKIKESKLDENGIETNRFATATDC